MKIIFALLFFFLFIVSSSAQTQRDIFFSEINFFLDETGTRIEGSQFENLLKENPMKYHRWDEIANDSIRIARLIPRNEQLKLSYPKIYQAVEETTNTSIQGNPVIVIFYNYLDDICSPASGFNNWNDLRIRKNKRFSDNVKRRIEKVYPNVIAYHFFEPGINIEPSQILKQYFLIDHEHFFRKTLFTTPSSCGSIAIIEPGGNTIIYNGEISVSEIADSLDR